MRNTRNNLAGSYAWILGVLLTVCPVTALGQDALPETQERRGPEPASKPEMDAAAEEPDVVPEKRRRLSRLGPQPMTPEQLEEAESLRKLAAKYGTDPTAIVGRIQLSSAYFDLPQGAQAVDNIVRVDLPYRRNFLLRMDAPFLKWTDPSRPGATSTQGFSDLAVTLGWRAYNTPEYAVLVGAVTTMPTAAESGLGLGKYTVGPTIATARFLPQWDSFLIGLFTQQISVGGDPSRDPINRSKVQVQVNSFWAERWWTVGQAAWQVDWERSAKSSMTFELELGRSVVGRLGMFVRPGIGIWGQDLLGAYEWNVEAGVRYMFTSF